MVGFVIGHITKKKVKEWSGKGFFLTGVRSPKTRTLQAANIKRLANSNFVLLASNWQEVDAYRLLLYFTVINLIPIYDENFNKLDFKISDDVYFTYSETPEKLTSPWKKNS